TAPSLLQNLGYDPRKDFDPIGLIAATPNLIAVHPSFPAHSLAELISVARQASSPIAYGSPGVGTLNHLTVELLAYRTGMKVAHVPYKGAGPLPNASRPPAPRRSAPRTPPPPPPAPPRPVPGPRGPRPPPPAAAAAAAALRGSRIPRLRGAAGVGPCPPRRHSARDHRQTQSG